MGSLFSEDFFKLLLTGGYCAITAVSMGLFLLLGYFWRKLPTQENAGAENGREAGAFPGVSLVIAARNESARLPELLPLWLEQTYDGPWELLIVNDASDDDTGTILDAWSTRYARLRVVHLPEKRHPGKKAALEAGIHAAKYDLLLLTDADCRPASPRWLQCMAAPMIRNSAIELVLGYAPLRAGGRENPVQRWSRFETIHTALLYFGAAAAGRPFMGVGRNMALRKSLYARLGGYRAHTHLTSGDDDLLVNAGATPSNVAMVLHPEAFVVSAPPSGWEAWQRQKSRHLSAGKAYRRMHQMLLGSLGMSYALHYFLLFILLVTGFAWKIALLLWLIRQLLLWWMYHKVLTRLHEGDFLSHFPIYDALMAVYYGAFVPFVLIGKRNHSWN